MSTKDKLNQAVVRIHGKMTGTGFFIDRDATILTCFHIIGNKETGELAEEEIVVTFDGEDYDAECVRVSHDPQALDVAILRLSDSELPPQASLLPLGEWGYDLEGDQDFRTLGYRSADEVKGLYAESEIRGHVATTSGIELLQFASEAVGAEEIRHGMSGSPVYHKSTKRIVGMVTLRLTEEGETIPCAIPIEAAADVWPQLKDCLRETDLLRQLRTVLPIGEWFTEKTFKAFYESLPLPGLIGFDRLGENKAEALFEQLVERGWVYDLINYLRVKRPDIPLTDLVEFPPVHYVNFVNREEELRESRGRYALPYLFFEAPAGYGKTELLKAIEQEHFRDGWLSIYVKAPQDVSNAADLAEEVARQADYLKGVSHFSDARSMGLVLGGVLSERVESLEASGLILLMDSIERLPEDEVDVFANHFLAGIRSALKKDSWRVRIAGRYIGSSWKRWAEEPEFNVRTLAPFSFKYVKQTVCALLPSQEDPSLYAAHLMHVTGGHPGCMARIIESTDVTQSIKSFFETREVEHREIVLSVAHEIRDSISETLQDTFDVLSVFRRYNYRLLNQIIEAGLVKHKGGAHGLETALTATYLVKRERGFIQDEIVRRLLARRLRWQEPERFRGLCEKARRIYRQDLKNVSSRPEFIALEGLFQELRCGYYGSEQTLAARRSLRDDFLAPDGILCQYLEMLEAKPNAPDAIADFKSLFENRDTDWEFRFVVNFFLRGEDYNNEPYEKTVAQIRDFFDQE
jgi:hypothetical protein